MKTWTKRIVILLETCSWVYIHQNMHVNCRHGKRRENGTDGPFVVFGPRNFGTSLNYFFFFQEYMYDVKCLQSVNKKFRVHIHESILFCEKDIYMMFSIESPSLLPPFCFYEKEELNIFRVNFHCLRSIFLRVIGFWLLSWWTMYRLSAIGS
jgi:hypothetical protein